MPTNANVLTLTGGQNDQLSRARDDGILAEARDKSSGSGTAGTTRPFVLRCDLWAGTSGRPVGQGDGRITPYSDTMGLGRKTKRAGMLSWGGLGPENGPHPLARVKVLQLRFLSALIVIAEFVSFSLT